MRVSGGNWLILEHVRQNNVCVWCQVDNQRYLVKHGLIVERIAKERKLRHVFLFNDIIVAAKQKVVNRSVVFLL